MMKKKAVSEVKKLDQDSTILEYLGPPDSGYFRFVPSVQERLQNVFVIVDRFILFVCVYEPRPRICVRIVFSLEIMK